VKASRKKEVATREKEVVAKEKSAQEMMMSQATIDVEESDT